MRLDTVGNVAVYVGIVILAASTVFLPDAGPILTRKGLLRALLREAEQGHAARHDDGSGPPRVAIGYNGNIDLVVSATDTLKALNIEPVLGPAAVAHDTIATREQLAATFSHFFSSSAAGERTITDAELFDDLVAAAQAQAAARAAPGGNAALMAMQLARENCPVLLAAKAGKQLRSLLGGRVRLAFDTDESGGGDEVHLILEYATGDTWGEATAQRANRFIVSSDEYNVGLKALEGMHASLESFAPDVIVAAGVHLLEGGGEEQYTARLHDVSAALKATVAEFPNARTHVEIGSMADEAFIVALADAVFPAADSIGMNEQEMADLYAALGGQFVVEAKGDSKGEVEVKGIEDGGSIPLRSEVSGRVPSPRAVAVTIRHLLRRYPGVSRVHFHSLAFHILAERRTPRSDVWGRAGAAAARASTTATLRACDATEPELHGRDLDLLLATKFSIADPEAAAADKAAGSAGPDGDGADETTRELTVENPVARWAWPLAAGGGEENAVAFKLAPVLVCKEPKQTVGLGDAISASGLAQHAFPRHG